MLNRLLAAAGMPTLPEPPSYCHLVTDDMDLQHMWKEVLSAVRVGILSKQFKGVLSY